MLRAIAPLALAIALAGCAGAAPALERVCVKGTGFALHPSGRPFIPWGFNYDHDEKERLIEDYWDAEWPKIVEDFREMAELGANVVRIHLQFGKFMQAPDRPNPKALDRLGDLLRLAEETRLRLDLAGRDRPTLARDWIRRLTAAIRKRDPRRLVTVGLVDWSLDRPGLRSGFVPEKIAADLDFIAVHLYPQKGKVDEALATLAGFQVGKPVVIEETFPLYCGRAPFEDFLERSKQSAAGWIGFYWGRTIEECRRSGTLGDAIVREWLELFRSRRPTSASLDRPSD